MSEELQWMIIRNSSCFLMRKKYGVQLTKEPNNLKNKNNFRFNGLIRSKAVGIEPATSGKGVVLVTKKVKKSNNPAQSLNKVTLSRGGARKTIQSIRNSIGKSKYRPDLKMAAVRRACAIMRSQKVASQK